ncbi:hypothetical protein LTR36_000767 [Oleoguttula mirabilis]|uniref:Uncharacterized protein n=1 Tax=Oleoguttula mirabilis TaxID=1507867 RepID=A0AAV9J410_9PEZI|nr:hypothetical protein LTR36_000767 [Oleoguttula mirabilis]
MYVYYSEEEADDEIYGRRHSVSGPDRTFRRAHRAYIILIAACAFAFSILLVSAVIQNRFPWYSQNWADVLGVAVTVFAAIQWIPQTWTTWHLGHLGSLSLTSLCLSAPFTWIFGVNMMIRVGIKGWSVWIVYVLVGTMQLLLVAMGIYFIVRERNKVEDTTAASVAPEYEHFEDWHLSIGRSRSRTQSMVSYAQSNMAPDERRPLLSGRRHTPTAAGSRDPSNMSRAVSSIEPDERRPLLPGHGQTPASQQSVEIQKYDGN